MAQKSGVWALKIGGSLWRDSRLRGWLDALAAHAGGRIVVVPGGGPFADQVRAAQACWGFADAAAHRMALRAMEQYALLLLALEPRLVPASSTTALHAALAAARVPVWLPAAMLEGREGIAEDWSVTSDSLAAWLAGELGATGLILLKALDLPSGDADLDSLSRRGMVDEALASFVRRSRLRVWWCGPAAAGRLAEALACGNPPGAEIPASRVPRAAT